MVSAPHATLQLPPLAKPSKAQLLAEAKEKRFSEIIKPVRKAAGKVDDAEILKLVERARTDHPRDNGRHNKDK